MLALFLREGFLDELFEREDVVDGDVFVDLMHCVCDGCGEGARSDRGADGHGHARGRTSRTLAMGSRPGPRASRDWRYRWSC